MDDHLVLHWHWRLAVRHWQFDVSGQNPAGNHAFSSDQPSGFPARKQALRIGCRVMYFSDKPKTGELLILVDN